MGICLDTLNTVKGSGSARISVVMTPGFYRAKIGKAEVKLSKAGNKYMSLRLQCSTLDKSASAGIVWDCITASDSKWAQYKLARLITACNIPLKGELELEDLAKLIANREVIIDVKARDDDPTRFEIDPFSHECYYSEAQFNEMQSATNTTAEPDDFMNVPEQSADAGDGADGDDYLPF